MQPNVIRVTPSLPRNRHLCLECEGPANVYMPLFSQEEVERSARFGVPVVALDGVEHAVLASVNGTDSGPALFATPPDDRQLILERLDGFEASISAVPLSADRLDELLGPVNEALLAFGVQLSVRADAVPTRVGAGLYVRTVTGVSVDPTIEEIHMRQRSAELEAQKVGAQRIIVGG